MTSAGSFWAEYQAKQSQERLYCQISLSFSGSVNKRTEYRVFLSLKVFLCIRIRDRTGNPIRYKTLDWLGLKETSHQLLLKFCDRSSLIRAANKASKSNIIQHLTSLWLCLEQVDWLTLRQKDINILLYYVSEPYGTPNQVFWSLEVTREILL